MKKEISHALIENKRPGIYTAMKYWGKKPHNIWSEYIQAYSNKNDIILDPFCGSAISAFESIRLGRKAYAFDLNPLSSFVIEALTSPYNDDAFSTEVLRIKSLFDNDKIYQSHFNVKCKHCGDKATIVNYKWNNSTIYELAIECEKCKTRYVIEEIIKNNDLPELINDFWFPNEEFPNNYSFSNAFIKNIGGNNYCNLWTKRNLYLLSKIFNTIKNQPNEVIKTQLMFGFIQCVHLCSKMCVPRRKDAKRDFSTSWGRSAFICAKRQMEMNAVYMFIRSCLGKQSVQSSLSSATNYLKNKPIIQNINASEKVAGANLIYGVVDIKNIDAVLPHKSIDFIITDPPYGGLIKYLDLSSIWLVWLKQYDARFTPIYAQELTVNTNKDLQKFSEEFTEGLQKLRLVLKDNATLILTFNTQDPLVWNSFISSIADAGFNIYKMIHQQNKRSGESNVASSFGISASDFYVHCVKSCETKRKVLTNIEFDETVVNYFKQTLYKRNEPTNFDILFAGVLTYLSENNIDLTDCSTRIKDALSKHIDSSFVLTKTQSGIKWGLIQFNKNKKTLTDKVKLLIDFEASRKKHIDKNTIIAKVYNTFSNELAPDPLTLKNLICNIEKGDTNE